MATDYVVNSGKNNECTTQDRRKLGEQVEEIASLTPFPFLAESKTKPLFSIKLPQITDLLPPRFSDLPPYLTTLYKKAVAGDFVAKLILNILYRIFIKPELLMLDCVH